VAPREAEVLMVDQEVVRKMRGLAAAGWGAKRIAGELGLARKTVRRYLRQGDAAALQVRARKQGGAARRRPAVPSLDAARAQGEAAPPWGPSFERRVQVQDAASDDPRGQGELGPAHLHPLGAGERASVFAGSTRHSSTLTWEDPVVDVRPGATAAARHPAPD
jgi:hypothetical protein